MTKRYRQRLVAVIALSFLSFTSPLLLIRNATAGIPSEPTANPKEIASLIKNLKSNNERELDATIKKLEKIGEPAIPALIEALQAQNLLVRRSAAQVLKQIAGPAIPALTKALKNSGADVRSSAADALRSIGVEDKTVVPQLIPLLKDSDASVRFSAAYALERITLSLQEKAKTLTSSELNQAVSNLESALKVLAEHKDDFSQSTIANLQAYLNILKAEQSDRLFAKSIIQNSYIWGTGIYLFLLLGSFTIRPLWLLKISETLKPK